MVGIDPTSEGLARAREMGLKTTADGVDGLLPHVLADGVQIAFDATSAYVHAENSRKLNELGVLMIDLTPAAIGPFCVPPVNLVEHVGKGEMNVNMVTCGGQATIPMVAAVSRVQAVATARSSPRCRASQRRPRHAQEHRRIHPHHRRRGREGRRRPRARPSSSSTRPSRR
jgi:acetaldehyde dehydrogenase (acetylating)